MCAELCEQNLKPLPLPKDWAANVRYAVLNIIGIVRIAMLAGREFLIQEGDVLHARIHRLETEVAMKREELRINGARMKRIDPHRRPQYSPIERMAILELRAMRGCANRHRDWRQSIARPTIDGRSGVREAARLRSKTAIPSMSYVTKG